MHRPLLPALVFTLLAASCTRGTPPKKTSAADGGAAIPGLPAELAGMKMPPPPDETRPVYPIKLQGAPDPLAVAFCQAVHDVPQKRRAECCGGTPGIVVTDECVRVVTYAVRDHAVRLDAKNIEACARDIQAAHVGCEWVGPIPPEIPPSCRKVFSGQLAAGARCRSSMECSGTDYCLGIGPVNAGKCGPSRKEGERCGLAVDPLAAYTRQDQVEREHSECTGFCGRRHICEPVHADGGECVMNSQCSAQSHCGGGKCMAGAVAQKDAPCSSDECAAGLRCTGGRCQVPREKDAACTTDFDCTGGCLKPNGAAPTAVGKCGMKCSSL